MGDSVTIKSTVNWAVLALVIEQPSYGYELGQRFERHFAGVLEPQISQIYAALSSLERAALVEPLPEEEQPLAVAALRPRAPAARHQPASTIAPPRRASAPSACWLADQIAQRSSARRAAAAARRHRRHRASTQLVVMSELIDNYERACVEEASRLPLRTRDDAGAPRRRRT